MKSYRHSFLLTQIKNFLNIFKADVKTFNVYSSIDGATMAIYDKETDTNYILALHLVKSEVGVANLTVDKLLDSWGVDHD